MKDLILEFLDAQLGKVLLLLALIWAGLCIYANLYTPLPAELTDVKPRDVYVGLDYKAISKASAESYYAAGPADAYLATGRFVFVPEVIVKAYVPPELDTPPLSVKRAPQLLPDPGPSLEGADKLPRFGDEFPAPLPSETPASKNGSNNGINTGSGFNSGTSGNAPSSPNSPGTPINK